jgi:hypothetical protein
MKVAYCNYLFIIYLFEVTSFTFLNPLSYRPLQSILLVETSLPRKKSHSRFEIINLWVVFAITLR